MVQEDNKFGQTLERKQARKRKIERQVLWQPLTKTVNSMLSKLMNKVSHEDYKRTQQGVSDVFLYYIYIYYYYKFYPKLYVSSISPPYHYHKTNML